MIDCQCHLRGSIHMIIGPMFSGKTTELFRLVKRYTLAGKKVVIVKYANDNRFDDTQACTHDLTKMEALKAVNISSQYNELKNYDVIGIDEGQFFEDIVHYSELLANMGKIVIIAALNGDYRQQPFKNVTSLIPCAEKIDKLSAVCHNCGHSASFTCRISGGTKLEVIGGAEMYRAFCRSCEIEHKRQQQQRKCSTLLPVPLKEQFLATNMMNRGTLHNA